METRSTVPRIKGSGLIGYLEWFAKEYGEETLFERVQQLPEQDRVLFPLESPALGLIATGWYECGATHRLLNELTDGLSAEERSDMARRASEYSVNLAMRGLFKLAFQLMGTPERYARYIQRFWSQLHDTGRRRIEIVGPGTADSLIEEWPGHHPFLCEVTTETMAAVFRTMGCVDVKVTRVQCVSYGDAHCRTALTWR